MMSTRPLPQSSMTQRALPGFRTARSLRGWFLAALGTVFVALAQAAPVAMVTDLQGQAVVHRGGGSRPVDILGELEAGDELALPGGARVVVTYLRSGEEFTASGPGRMSVSADQLQARAGAAPQRRVSQMASLSGRLAPGSMV